MDTQITKWNFAQTDNIFTVREIFGKCHEYNKDLYNRFVDYTQAFDSVNRKNIIESLTQYEIPSKIQDGSNMTGTNCDLFTHK
jgi:hypothetical protein